VAVTAMLKMEGWPEYKDGKDPAAADEHRRLRSGCGQSRPPRAMKRAPAAAAGRRGSHGGALGEEARSRGGELDGGWGTRGRA